MPTLTEEQIKEIADQLDCGFRSFWHKMTGELLFVPDLNNIPLSDAEFFEDDLEKLDNNFGDYIEIEKPNSSDSFKIMANFTEQLNDNDKIKNELINALNKKKPFREFKFIIDNHGLYRQQWFDFKNAQLKQWVSDKFHEATYDDRENGRS
ncbi:MAG: hypothetical protein IPN13_15000 [Bacteroidetes bacterium]|jgi:hypothetical protein|nr:hypothetical protein [Bacteroidota bacterium]